MRTHTISKFISTFLLLFLLTPLSSIGQHPFRTPHSASDLIHELKRVKEINKVLYLAAHPDDENTQVISYLSSKKHVKVGYLSLTRGDGGQNLIGKETGPLLGVLRTQELMEARKVDKGVQFFTRAIDFGYSKTADETFNIWGKEAILKDVVRVIRKFRPDVIITRFPAGGYEGGHGHHTGSAILAEEAFEKAGDPKVFPDQLKTLETWSPKRLLFNTSTWWDKKLPAKVKRNNDLFRVDVGGFDPLSGRSYTEIAAESRSMHKCQGFGVEKDRGTEWEYFKLIKGEPPKKDDILSGLEKSWEDLEGGKTVGTTLQKAIEEFKPEAPHGSIPLLVKAYKALDNVEDPHLKARKKQELKELILACTGFYMETTTTEKAGCKGGALEITTNVINRSPSNLKLKKIRLWSKDTTIGKSLKENKKVSFDLKAGIPKNARISTPYWLIQPPKKGTYQVPGEHDDWIGNPETPPTATCKATLEVEGHPFTIEYPVEHKWVSEVKGGQYEPFRVLPKATVSLGKEVYVFSDDVSKEVAVEIISHQERIKGKVELDVPEKWEVSPQAHPVEIKKKGGSTVVVFEVKPPKNASKGVISPYLTMNGERYDQRSDIVDHEHITRQVVVRDASSECIRLNVNVKGKKVGYLMGSGDKVPEALEQLGYEVTRLNAGDLDDANLSQFDAILTGVRAFNVIEELKFKNKVLFNYVKEGGHMIVQYNKDKEDLVTKEVAPYPLHLSYDRVTVETAEPNFLAPDHPIMNQPNRIDKKDFEGWVQERGLYFPDEWDDAFTPLISWHDPNEDPKKGGLLVAEHGKGTFIYTGIAFFRQLPAGVPGAFKLFANILSYGKLKNEEQ